MSVTTVVLVNTWIIVLIPVENIAPADFATRGSFTLNYTK